METIKLTISYDGTDYAGFQSQTRPGAVTIQDVLQRALTQVLGEAVILHASGRTDSGVHALAQVAHLTTSSRVPIARIAYATNHLLPRDIAITAVSRAEPGWHARKSAIGKHYRYTIYNDPIPQVIGNRYFAHIPYPLDEACFRQGMAVLQGTHNFQGYCASGSSVKSYERTLHRICLTREDRLWHVDFYGDGFLRKMVRNITGSLIDVASGRKPFGLLAAALASGERRQAGQTAPACGLTLMAVYYEQTAWQQVLQDTSAT